MTTTVFVSGATGYIAQHLVKQLIAKGYKVIGSVRSAAKGDKLKENLKSDNFSYAIVPDIGNAGAFDDALKAHPEVTVFLHTASPFHFNSTDLVKDILNPAVEGTKNALSAIAKYGPNVKRVVVTSSYASIMDLQKERIPTTVFTEESWNPITWEESKSNAIFAYVGSKTFAEKAAWDFVEAEKPNFILSTVNPAYVFGPQAFDNEVTATLNTSAEIINNIIKLKADDEVPAFDGGFIDVRNVAEAHILAFEKKEAENQRLLMVEARFSNQDILDIVNENFADKFKGKLPAGNPGTGPELVKHMAQIDNHKTRGYFGHKFIGLKETVVATIKQVVDVNGTI